ncbi:unnamed protein product [Schistosoma turkestanicum]|nr:unnamed protein product [Schistosoma turkestanicum]
MTQFISLFRDRLIGDTHYENSKLNALTENNAQLFRRISKLEESLNSLKSFRAVETTQYELKNKVNGSIVSDNYSSLFFHNSPEQTTFDHQKNLYYNLETINFDKRLEAMEKKLRNLFVETNTPASTDVLNKYAVKIVTETYHPLTTFNQNCKEFCQSAKQTSSRCNDCLHLDLNDLQSCNQSARSNRTVQTVDIFNKYQHIDKSVQTAYYESINIATDPKYSNEEATFTNENRIMSKPYKLSALERNNQFTNSVLPNHHVNRVNKVMIYGNDNILKEDNDDDESISKFTSSEYLDIMGSPDSEASRLKQTYYNKGEKIGLNQLRQTHSFESGLNNDESYTDSEKIPATSRSYKRNQTFESNFHYGTIRPSIHNSRKASTLESSFETIYDQTKLCYKL